MLETDLSKRIFLFLVLCIPSRLLLTYLTYKQLVPGLLLLGIGVSFWLIYLLGLRKTGAETFGDTIWWDNLRPIHGTNYIIAGITGRYEYLLFDTIVGLMAFLFHHNLISM